MSRNDRYKTWLFLLWEDNHYPDFMERLQSSGVQAAISPLHNNDLWGYNDSMIDDPRVGLSRDLRDFNLSLGSNFGEPGQHKKAHRHIVLSFSGSKSQDQVNDFVCKVFSDNPCLPMVSHSISGAVRYLVHYDNPDKEQFAITSIISVNGFDVEKYFKPTVAQEDELFYSLLVLIEEHNFCSFYNLLFYLSNAAKNGDYVEEFRYCRSHVHLISSFVRSRGAESEAAARSDFNNKLLSSLNDIGASIRVSGTSFCPLPDDDFPDDPLIL